MKLSSRKKLLKEADNILVEIRRKLNNRKVNEIDWERHKAWLKDDPRVVPQYLSKYAATDVYHQEMEARGFRNLEKKYSKLPPNSYTPEQKQAEIDQLLADVRKLRDHISRREEIPMDPEQQTELQKILVNHPIVTPEQIKKDPNSVIYKDPATGLLWNVNFGAPTVPWDLIRMDEYERKKFREAIKMVVDADFKREYPGIAEWDHSRGFFWNLFNRVLNTGIFGSLS